jgi:hypothetical protein
VHRILADDGMAKWLLGLLLSISGAFDPPRPPPEVYPPLTPVQLASHAADRLDTRVHITGCAGDRLVGSEVEFWSDPLGTRVVGTVSGRGFIGRRCQGEMVVVLNAVVYRRIKMFEVETIVDRKVGWVAEESLGRLVDPSECLELIGDTPENHLRCSPAISCFVPDTRPRPYVPVLDKNAAGFTRPVEWSRPFRP